MVCLDKVGVSSKALEGGRLVLVEPGDKLIFEHLNMRKALPGELAPQVLPNSLGGVELGTAWWLEQQPNVLGDA